MELRDVPIPEIEEGAVLVEMKSSGICGTDLEKLRGGYTASLILGHEVAGVISESRSENFRTGDLVIPHHHVACGDCYFCAKGAETMCDGFRTSNFDPGGFTDYFRVPSYNVARGGVHKFDGLTFEEASFVEPLGCCIRGLDKVLLSIRHSPDGRIPVTNVLVVGAGPIGLLHMELLREKFPGLKLCAVDISETRLSCAERFEGAKAIKPKADGSFSEEAKRLSDNDGMDLVIVSTGSPAAFAEAVKCVRRSGALLLFGAPPKGSSYGIDLQSMLLRELSLTSSYATTEAEMSKAVSLLEARRINVAKFVSSKYPLDQINDAMTRASAEGQVKVIVTR